MSEPSRQYVDELRDEIARLTRRLEDRNNAIHYLQDAMDSLNEKLACAESRVKELEKLAFDSM